MVSVDTDTVRLSEEQRLVQRSIRQICDDFGPEYWREKDLEGEYPQEFVDVLSEEGWMGALVPRSTAARR